MEYLFSYFPELRNNIPYIPLGKFPTPIEGPFRFEDSQIWIKGDHLASPIHGGNKVRKLEIALARAKKEKARTILLGGAQGSNWCVGGIIFGKEEGFQIHSLLFPQPRTPYMEKNYQFILNHGDQVTHLAHPLLLPIAMKWYSRLGAYPLPLGGTSGETCLGYVNAGLELIHQIQEGILEKPHEIWLPLGTGGTAAGLLLGLELGGIEDVAIHAVRVVDLPLANPWRVHWLAWKARKILESLIHRVLPKKKPPPLMIHHNGFGRGYGWPSFKSRRGISIMKELAHINLEPTYTGKTAGVLFQYLKSRKNRKVLFWNTYNGMDLSKI